MDKKEKHIATENLNSSDGITFCKLLVLLVAGSIAGVGIEGVYCLITKGHWESHVVSVLGQFNFLYGFGAMLFYVGAAKLKDKKTAVQISIMMAEATILELVCGLLLKYGFGMRAWNYDKNFLNYKGLICLSFSAAWGIAAFVFCKLYSKLDHILMHCRGKKWTIVCTILAVVVVFDLGLTGAYINRWSERHYGIEAKTQLQKDIDAEAPDEYMQARFMEWRFLE